MSVHQRHKWHSPVVGSFCKSVGSRIPERAFEFVCNELITRLNRKTPPFQTHHYEFADLPGIKVIESNIECEGILSILGDHFIIQVRNGDSPQRRSFSVCHETGHIQLYETSRVSSSENIWSSRRSLCFLREEGAFSNFFAENLLMPRRIFERTAQSLNPGFESLWQLAPTFCTSLTATTRRAVTLDIWPVQMVRCVPEKMVGGSYALRILGLRTSASLKNPLFSRKDNYTKVGLDLVLESCRCESFFSASRKIAGKDWCFKCTRPEGTIEKAIMMLVFPNITQTTTCSANTRVAK